MAAKAAKEEEEIQPRMEKMGRMKKIAKLKYRERRHRIIPSRSILYIAINSASYMRIHSLLYSYMGIR